MSSESLPITPARFAAALEDLPLASLHLKAAELRNSISHLQYSNEQLMPFSTAGDLDCSEAILENAEVIKRMEERIGLLKAEVEGRGMPWVEDEAKTEQQQGDVTQQQSPRNSTSTNSALNGQTTNGTSTGNQRGETVPSTSNGASDPNEEEEGLHL